MELQNCSKLACVSILMSSLICLYNCLMRILTAGSLLSLCLSLIGATVSSEIGLPSERSLLYFGVALLTPMLITVTIKSVYLSMSLVDLTAEKSAEPRAASRVDWNTSLSFWSDLYLVWLLDEFLHGGA